MNKYICTICGFIYEESLGYPKDNIQPGTLWQDVPSTWQCPLCGASKNEFDLKDEIAADIKTDTIPSQLVDLPSEINYTAAELSAIFSNIAKGWEKQYQLDNMAMCNELATYYNNHAETSSVETFRPISELIKEDLSTTFSTSNQIASSKKDRGSLRALKWAEQVTKMNNAHLNRYESEGPTILEKTNVYVCEICGFVLIADDKPEVCPVCKVPSIKMIKIERSA